MSNLTVKKVQALKEPGMFSDGNGLYLRVGPTGGKSWILRTVIHGKRRELGLGSASLVSLAEARELARKYRKIAREGGDPDLTRKQQSMTFSEAAKQVHKNLLPTWKNAKHAETWLRTLESYAYPHFGDRPIHTIGSSDVLVALSEIWTDKPETAKRLKQRISTVFDWAKGAGQYPYENPVNGLKKSLPVVKRQANHMAAMAWQDVPDFIEQSSQRKAVTARCLEFLILTASRSIEARGARWDEINIETGIWIVPAERMKRGVEHRVPLSGGAIDVLEKVKDLDRDLVFPSPMSGNSPRSRELSVMAFKPLLKRMERDGFTVHGFRSSFRDWASESARADREVAEAALSHATGSAVERSYARSDLFERRRELMSAWSRYVSGKIGTVVDLVRTR